MSLSHLGVVEDTDITLDKAALEIAALDHVGLQLVTYLHSLDEMAERLRSRAHGAPSLEAQAAALAAVLAGEFRFDGDRETYDDPANADLISVMDRRRGLPVALSILYVALARRMGWIAHAIGAPGHVLVGLGESPLLLLDPFNRGVVVRPHQLATLLAPATRLGAAHPTEQMAPMSNRQVLVRLLNNQATRAEQANELDRAATILERITTVAPTFSEGWWERARLEAARGNPAKAREHLTSMLETTRDPALRNRVCHALDGLAGQ